MSKKLSNVRISDYEQLMRKMCEGIFCVLNFAADRLQLLKRIDTVRQCALFGKIFQPSETTQSEIERIFCISKGYCQHGETQLLPLGGHLEYSGLHFHFTD